MLQFINPIKIIVLLTFLVGLFFLKFRNPTHQKVLGILSICFINEFVALILKAQEVPIDNLFNINVIIHNTLWLMIIGSFLNETKFIIVAHIVFGIINLLFFEGLSKFNYFTFVFGALLYTIIFIYLSFKHLKKENLAFFLSNQYILLFAPVLFFLGLSFMFSFKSKELTSTYIFDGVKLYTFINYFVNLIYYFFINLYIYKEKKKGYV
jgi:hypothetical protein